MRISFKKEITPQRIADILTNLFEHVQAGPDGVIIPTAVNIYISFRKKDTGEKQELQEDQWEVVSEPYCHTDKVLLWADAEKKIYIYRLEEKKEVTD